MKTVYAELTGAWEVPGVIGTRIEIDGKKLTVLWRSSPVLETTYAAEQSDGCVELKLKKSGLRYAQSDSDYAEMRSIIYRDGALEITEYFPISGESRDTLKRTDNSRYGNYDIADDILREMQGTWRETEGRHEIVIKKDVMSFDGEKRRIHILKSRSSYGSPYIIADHDPSVDEWHGMSRFEYVNGVLTTRIRVCDAPTIELYFKKVR